VIQSSLEPRLEGRFPDGIARRFLTAWVSGIIMPTILRLNGLRLVIYPNDHGPEHVHVIGAGTEAVFWLGCPDGPVTLRESYGFTTRQLTRLLDELTEVLPTLCNAWRNIHDPE
jgi:hypothetical protein